MGPTRNDRLTDCVRSAGRVNGCYLYMAPTPDGKRVLVADWDGLWHLDANTCEQLPGQYARFKDKPLW